MPRPAVLPGDNQPTPKDGTARVQLFVYGRYSVDRATLSGGQVQSSVPRRSANAANSAPRVRPDDQYPVSVIGQARLGAARRADLQQGTRNRGIPNLYQLRPDLPSSSHATAKRFPPSARMLGSGLVRTAHLQRRREPCFPRRLYGRVDPGCYPSPSSSQAMATVPSAAAMLRQPEESRWWKTVVCGGGVVTARGRRTTRCSNCRQWWQTAEQDCDHCRLHGCLTFASAAWIRSSALIRSSMRCTPTRRRTSLPSGS